MIHTMSPKTLELPDMRTQGLHDDSRPKGVFLVLSASPPPPPSLLGLSNRGTREFILSAWGGLYVDITRGSWELGTDRCGPDSTSHIPPHPEQPPSHLPSRVCAAVSKSLCSEELEAGTEHVLNSLPSLQSQPEPVPIPPPGKRSPGPIHGGL